MVDDGLFFGNGEDDTAVARFQLVQAEIAEVHIRCLVLGQLCDIPAIGEQVAVKMKAPLEQGPAVFVGDPQGVGGILFE